MSRHAAFVAIAKAPATKIFHFWGTKSMSNHVETVWVYWNLLDFTPEGRPDIPTPPQEFRSEFLERHYLNAK